MRRDAHTPSPMAKRRPAGAGRGWSRFLPEILICTAAIALSFGLRLIAFLH